MALANRTARPEPLFAAAKQLTPSAGHPFDQKLNHLLDENDKRGHSSFPMNVPFLQCRGDKTAIELFLRGIRALALQSSIIDVVRIASRISIATG
jgi:hypothetical protein